MAYKNVKLSLNAIFSRKQINIESHQSWSGRQINTLSTNRNTISASEMPFEEISWISWWVKLFWTLSEMEVIHQDNQKYIMYDFFYLKWHLYTSKFHSTDFFFSSQWSQPSFQQRSGATSASHLCFTEPSLGLQFESLWASVSPHFIEVLPQDWNKWESVLWGYQLAHTITSLLAEAMPSSSFCRLGVWLDGSGPGQCPGLISSREFPGCFAEVSKASGAAFCFSHSIPNK